MSKIIQITLHEHFDYEDGVVVPLLWNYDVKMPVGEVMLNMIKQETYAAIHIRDDMVLELITMRLGKGQAVVLETMTEGEHQIKAFSFVPITTMKENSNA